MMGQKECKKYIECDAAKEAVYKIIVPEWVHVAFKTCIDDVPAADVRPVVRGKWNRTDAYPHRLYCSVCNKTYLKNDELLERWEFPLNFCPNCGLSLIHI